MGTATQMVAAPAKAAAHNTPQTPPPAPSVPFIRATHRHVETFFDKTQVLSANPQQLGPFEIPAYGFLGHVVLLVEVTGDAAYAAPAAQNADFPFNVLQDVYLTDVSGAYIVFPSSGYQLFLENLFGAYVWASDPRNDANYVGNSQVAGAGTKARFILRVPVEITPWDAFGALPNQNATSTLKVHLSLAPNFGAAGVTSVRVRGMMEAYAQPNPVDLLNQPQEIAPPGLGTTQFWSVFSPLIGAGEQQIRLTRLGNNIRNLILVARDGAGVRQDAILPDPISVTWDGRILTKNEPKQYRQHKIYEQYGFSPPAGVLAYCYTDDQDGHAGYENRHLWLPTVQSTRIDVEGNFGGAGQLEILTNDIGLTDQGR